MHHLDHDRTIERYVQGVVDVGHSAFAYSMHHAVSPAGYVTESSDCRIRRLDVAIDDDWPKLAAAQTARGVSAIP
jgi:hypothetical protein